jgi:DNA-binding MurR/RpiR family transcriptional regulator
MPTPPTEYEDLIRLIHDRYEGLSKTYKKIAVYLTQNPNDVAVLSVNAIGERCGIHPSSFVRFAQALDYQGFKELQGVFQKRLSSAAPGFEARIKALAAELDNRSDQPEFTFLHELILRDIASLRSLLDDIAPEDLVRAVDLLQAADTVYLLGQMRSAPVVDLLRYILTMLDKRTVLLDSSGGLATYVARGARAGDVLFAVSFRFYAKEVVTIVEETAARGVPVIALSDTTLSPLAKNTEVLFAVPEHEYTFSRSLAAPMCLAQAIAVALAARMQKTAETPRIPTVTQT